MATSSAHEAASAWLLLLHQGLGVAHTSRPNTTLKAHAYWAATSNAHRCLLHTIQPSSPSTHAAITSCSTCLPHPQRATCSRPIPTLSHHAPGSRTIAEAALCTITPHCRTCLRSRCTYGTCCTTRPPASASSRSAIHPTLCCPTQPRPSPGNRTTPAPSCTRLVHLLLLLLHLLRLLLLLVRTSSILLRWLLLLRVLPLLLVLLLHPS